MKGRKTIKQKSKKISGKIKVLKSKNTLSLKDQKAIAKIERSLNKTIDSKKKHTAKDRKAIKEIEKELTETLRQKEDEYYTPEKVGNTRGIEPGAWTRIRFRFLGFEGSTTPEIIQSVIKLETYHSLYYMVRKVQFNSPRVRQFFSQFDRPNSYIEGSLTYTNFIPSDKGKGKMSAVNVGEPIHLDWNINRRKILYLLGI